MFKHILMPIAPDDIGRGTETIQSIRTLINEAETVTICSILPSIPDYVDLEIPSEIHFKNQKTTEESLSTLVQKNELDDKTKIIVKEGNAHHDILELTETNNVDLVVISSHQPGWEDYLLGSTASKVVRHAKCPVLVLR